MDLSNGANRQVANNPVSNDPDSSTNFDSDNNPDPNFDSNPVCLVSSGGDTVDARSIFDVFRGKSQAQVGQLTTHAESLMYNMKHENRGRCIIINNRTFDGHTRLNERRGTEIDATALYNCFRSLEFDAKMYTDASAKDIMHIFKDAASDADYHKKSDCIVVCILTHGEAGVLWARDEKYSIDAVFSFFKGDNCVSLAGKPKLFFIQACQGDRLDSGVTLYSSPDVTDGPLCYRIPNFADFLISYSTVPGHYSWRNTTQGSWFIQALVKVLGENSKTMDLLTMMTIVNRKVAYEFESNVPNDPEFDKKKQIPCITSMLTRLIYFPSKI